MFQAISKHGKRGAWVFLNYIRSKVKELEPDLDPAYFSQLTSELDDITHEVEENLESFREKFESVKREKAGEHKSRG